MSPDGTSPVILFIPSVEHRHIPDYYPPFAAGVFCLRKQGHRMENNGHYSNKNDRIKVSPHNLQSTSLYAGCQQGRIIIFLMLSGNPLSPSPLNIAGYVIYEIEKE